MKNSLMKFAAVGALAAGMAFAQAPVTNPPASNNGQTSTVRPRARFHQRMMNALNLTDAQKQQAKTIFQQARESAKPVFQELKQNRQALTAAVKADNNSQIRELAAKQGNLRGQLLAIRSGAMAKFYQVLTPEQRAKADQMHQKMHTRMQERFGRRANRTNG